MQTLLSVVSELQNGPDAPHPEIGVWVPGRSFGLILACPGPGSQGAWSGDRVKNDQVNDFFYGVIPARAKSEKEPFWPLSGVAAPCRRSF